MVAPVVDEAPQALDEDKRRASDLRIFDVAACHLVGVMIQIPGRPRAGDEGRDGRPGRVGSSACSMHERPRGRIPRAAPEVPTVGWPGPGRRSLAPPHPDSAAAAARLPAATVRMIAAVIRPISRERCGRRRSQGLGTRRHRPRKRRCPRRGWGQIVTGKRTRLHWPEMGQSQPGRLDALGLAA